MNKSLFALLLALPLLGGCFGKKADTTPANAPVESADMSSDMVSEEASSDMMDTEDQDSSDEK